MHTLIESDQRMILDPLGLKLVDLCPGGPLSLHHLQALRQRLDISLDAKDELMVPHVDGAADECSRLRVRTGNDQVLAAHQIPLKACCYESVNMVARGDQYFAAQVPAFLPAVQLVFKVHRGSPVFRKQLRQLDDSSQTSMSGEREVLV